MRTREPRLSLSLQQALASSTARPCFAGMLCAARVSASSHADSLGLRIHVEQNRGQRCSLKGQEQLCGPRALYPKLLTCVSLLACELAER